MDYNYVRMRNALKNGDIKNAERYRKLLETEKSKKLSFSGCDYIIAILLCVSILLGIYIYYSEISIMKTNETETAMVLTSEV